MEGTVSAALETQQHKESCFFTIPPSLFSEPCSLHHNFKLPFLSILRSHKDDECCFFMLPHVLLDTKKHCIVMHCSSVLPRALGLTGVTISFESHNLCWVRTPSSPHLSLLGAHAVWVERVGLCWNVTTSKFYFLLSLQMCTKFTTLKADNILYFRLTDMVQPIYFLKAFSQRLCS